LLFIIYISTFGADFELLLHKLFADDAKVYSIVSDENDRAKFQSDLDKIFIWSQNYQLSLAFQKCSVLHLGHSNHHYSYYFGNTQITRETTVRDLGITVSDTLSFSIHCADVAKRGMLRVNVIYASFLCRNRNFLLRMFITFARPILEFATEIWSPFFVKDIDLIERVQRRFTKRIPGLSNLSYEQRLQILNLKTLKHRRTVRDLVMVFKIFHSVVDMNPDTLFQLSFQDRTRGHQLKLHLKFAHLQLRKNFFAFRVVKIWNNLSNAAVTLPTVVQFRRHIDSLQFS
jgi:hypothetical protein